MLGILVFSIQHFVELVKAEVNVSGLFFLRKLQLCFPPEFVLLIIFLKCVLNLMPVKLRMVGCSRHDSSILTNYDFFL